MIIMPRSSVLLRITAGFIFGAAHCASAWAQPSAPSLSLEATEVVHGIGRFSLDLYKQSIEPGKNLFLSPASVSIAMALAYRGAAGATASEIQSTMHYFAEPARYIAANGDVLKSLDISGPGRELRNANALWIQKGSPIKADYLQDVQTHFKAGLNDADYCRDPQGARKTINDWVSAATNNKINDLLGEPHVKNETRAILVNTLYWKGDWARPFSAETSRQEDFTRLDGSKVSTKLMHQFSEFAVLRRDGFDMIQMPYVHGEVSMAILLPRDADGLPRLESRLTDERLGKWLSELDEESPRTTVLTLPKMHLNWRADLVEKMKALGMKAPFEGGADFSAMSAGADPCLANMSSRFAIGAIVHQTFLDVDEKGSEAAAATAIVDVIVSGGRRGPPPPPPFISHADKPFLFLLRDTRTKLILFMGRYVDPAAG